MKDSSSGRSPSPPGGMPAELLYRSADFEIIAPGAYVICAVTGAPIPLAELRYWSAERQEAYASPEAVSARHRDLK